jgi:hypothetical protein
LGLGPIVVRVSVGGEGVWDVGALPLGLESIVVRDSPRREKRMERRGEDLETMMASVKS